MCIITGNTVLLSAHLSPEGRRYRTHQRRNGHVKTAKICRILRHTASLTIHSVPHILSSVLRFSQNPFSLGLKSRTPYGVSAPEVAHTHEDDDKDSSGASLLQGRTPRIPTARSDASPLRPRQAVISYTLILERSAERCATAGRSRAGILTAV